MYRQVCTRIRVGVWGPSQAPSPVADRANSSIRLGSYLVGDATRLELTVLGDTVNVAARLEQAIKRYSTVVLASAAVVTAAGEQADWRQISDEPLPGRTEQLAIMAPITEA